MDKCGLLETVTIYYHPVTGKHLGKLISRIFPVKLSISRFFYVISQNLYFFFSGLAHMCFEEVKSAKECCQFLHGKSVMGQVRAIFGYFATLAIFRHFGYFRHLGFFSHYI